MNLSRRRHRRLRLLRRWRLWVILALAALLSLLCRLLLLGATDDGGVATHVVRAGDTIPRLCWQYKVRSEAIRAANPGVDDPLPPGRKLLIPLGHFDPAALAAPALASMPKQAAHPAPPASPRPGKSPGPGAATTRLPPQPPEPAVQPTPRLLGTVVAAGSSRP